MATSQCIVTLYQLLKLFAPDVLLRLVGSDLLHLFGEAVEDEEDIIDQQLWLREGPESLQVELLRKVGVDLLVQGDHLQ